MWRVLASVKSDSYQTVLVHLSGARVQICHDSAHERGFLAHAENAADDAGDDAVWVWNPSAQHLLHVLDALVPCVRARTGMRTQVPVPVQEKEQQKAA